MSIEAVKVVATKLSKVIPLPTQDRHHESATSSTRLCLPDTLLWFKMLAVPFKVLFGSLQGCLSFDQKDSKNLKIRAEI
jgi:hypothetical protein